MSIEKIADRVIETDVLLMGGGIAGCPAAAKAAEHGLKVTLAEKAKTDRSGSGGGGSDHWPGAYPRGMTPQEFLEIWNAELPHYYGAGGYWSDPNLMYRLYANGFWALEELEKFGVTMKWDDGALRPMSGYGVREGGRPVLRVHWQNVKPEMAAGVRKAGVNVLDRTMVVDLLTNNGTVVGATALNTRTGEFIVIKAKAVIIATGLFARCYNSEQPASWKYKMRYHWSPATASGDGWAVAYRAGAELSSMELHGGTYRWRDDLCLPFGQMGNEGVSGTHYAWDGEENPGWRHLTPYMYAELEQKGKLPIYASLEPIPDEYQKRIEMGIADERMISLKIAEDRGFNPRTHRYELMDNRQHHFMAPAGIAVDNEFKSSLKGLFAVGDSSAGVHNFCNASTGGFLIGDDIRSVVNEADEPVIDEAQVESQKQTALAPLFAKGDTESLELESAIRYVCDRYVGVYRAEGKLREGVRRLGSLRREFMPRLMAKNPHHLMRCLEVRNIMDLAGAHIQACVERKETHGDHIRIDYPDVDQSRLTMLTYQRMENGKPVLEVRRMPEFNAELAKEEK